MKEGLKLQQVGAHKISTGGAARLDGLIGPELPRMQAGPSNCLRVLKSGKRGYWGLKKGFKVARSGPLGGASGSKAKWRMEEGGYSPWCGGLFGPPGRSSMDLCEGAPTAKKVGLVWGELPVLRVVGKKGCGWCLLSAL